MRILDLRMRKKDYQFTSPVQAQEYLKLKLGLLEHEVFGMLCLDTKNRLIVDKLLFRGSINHTNVLPREVIKEALSANSSSILLYHNHPGGCPHPSPADKSITQVLIAAAKMVDIRVVDHIIVAGNTTTCFAQLGLI